MTALVVEKCLVAKGGRLEEGRQRLGRVEGELVRMSDFIEDKLRIWGNLGKISCAEALNMEPEAERIVGRIIVIMRLYGW